ncbi:response regulator [Flammeovirga kamogawensis]|uniref:Response regulator n=1 Tax=Flammeovirga kamogawensis TaxID=373891 RepID=A0ABX8GZT8_9BACT|nr:response regulator [Flammeovirga kamogawensis]MBB6459307.1 CheY-like chemotaxis protein [Flammeovirga kamogawensis]QWG08867.1 response regulator [Flammeovirga kamogawensis]TRX67157.1 response regulator [Flammeovirga kamogawensis]
MKQLIFIDDDLLAIEIFKIISNALEEVKSYKKLFYRSGDHFFESVETLKIEKQNILFLDLNMPGLDGWQVLDELENRGIVDHFKIFILSSSVNPQDKQKANDHPKVCSYIEKPLSKQKVLSTLALLSEIETSNV